MRPYGPGLGMLLAAACPAAAQHVTFCKDVAPILYKHCAACHRPGEVGPFPLLTYQDARKKARHIKEITAARRMPPWMPEPVPFGFLDERRLSAREIATLAAWADSGAREGDPKHLPPPPKFVEGWQLGEPDLVIKMPEPFTIPADGPDVFQAFVIPIPVEKLRYVKGYEYRPGNRKVVHHANVFLDDTGELRKRAEREKGPGFRTNAGIELLGRLPEVGSWAPGNTPRFLLGGAAREVRPGTSLIIHNHYHPSGKPETDQSTVGLYFSDTPPSKAMTSVSLRVAQGLGNTDLLKIKAGERRHKVELTRTLPEDALAHAVVVHAHYLLKELTLTATPPSGKAFPLLEIRNWDFNWQDRYHYETLPKLPRGTRLDVLAVYDNSEDNPQNPSRPPKDVRWGFKTTDEMLGVTLALTRDPAGGGGGPVAKGGPTKLRLPEDGVPMPDGVRQKLQPYDANRDGRLTMQEIEAMPAPIRQRVVEALRGRYGEKQ